MLTLNDFVREAQWVGEWPEQATHALQEVELELLREGRDRLGARLHNLAAQIGDLIKEVRGTRQKEEFFFFQFKRRTMDQD